MFSRNRKQKWGKHSRCSTRPDETISPAPLQKCVGDFRCINFGGFCRGFSWRIFLGTFSHKNEEKNPARKSAKKSGGPKIKIREKSVPPKTDQLKPINFSLPGLRFHALQPWALHSFALSGPHARRSSPSLARSLPDPRPSLAQGLASKAIYHHTLKTVTSLNTEARLLKFHFSSAIMVFGDNEPKCSKCYDRKGKIAFSTSKCCNR